MLCMYVYCFLPFLWNGSKKNGQSIYCGPFLSLCCSLPGRLSVDSRLSAYFIVYAVCKIPQCSDKLEPTKSGLDRDKGSGRSKRCGVS